MKKVKIFKKDDINLKDIFINFGFVTKKPLIEHISFLFKQKMKIVPTMKELYEYSGINLIITAYNISDRNIEYFSHISHPDANVVDCIALSVNIPFLFEKEIMNNKYYIDAGCKRNIEWNYFKNIENKNKIGILLKSNKNISNKNEKNTLLSYIDNIISVLIDDGSLNTQNENICVVETDCKTIFDFEIEDKLFENLLETGKEKMYEHLKKCS